MKAGERRGDPLRRFRIGTYAVYLVVVGGFCLSILVSLVRSVSQMTPRHSAAREAVLSPRECVGRVETLWQELEDRRKALTSRPPASEADNAWAEFRVQWMERHREAEATCGVDSPGRQSLRALFRRLDKAMDLYTTHAVQYAGEVGPTADAFSRELATARSEAMR